MKTLLSPKMLAHAIGVSESSVKRWIDDGEIRALKTAGGHRRIPISEAVRYIRRTCRRVVRPELLGLPGVGKQEHVEAQEGGAVSRLHRLLSRGRVAEARGLLVSLYLTGGSVAALADGPIRETLRELGGLFHRDRRGILVEHQATEACIAAVRQIQSMIEPGPGAPAAVGGAPPGDVYVLPSLLAAVVLADAGFRAVNLGPQTPLDLLRQAAEEEHAVLVWLSISDTPDVAALHRDVRALAAGLEADGRRLVIGGREPELLPRVAGDHVYVGRTMAELGAYGRSLVIGQAGTSDRARVSRNYPGDPRGS